MPVSARISTSVVVDVGGTIADVGVESASLWFRVSSVLLTTPPCAFLLCLSTSPISHLVVYWVFPYGSPAVWPGRSRPVDAFLSAESPLAAGNLH